MDIASLIQSICILALPVIFAITLHEAAHGFAAKRFGDNTAWVAGRVSLNPLRHIDPVGTIVVPLVILVVSHLAAGSGLLFGWAKPVPVNFGRLKNPKRDMLWVAAAGPLANLIMAVGWAGIFKVTDLLPANVYTYPLEKMGAAGLSINLVLMVLNLLPVPPLDGGRIAISLLPMRAAIAFSKLEQWGFPLLMLLLFSGLLDNIIGPVVLLLKSLIIILLGLN